MCFGLKVLCVWKGVNVFLFEQNEQKREILCIDATATQLFSNPELGVYFWLDGEHFDADMKPST